MSHYCKICGKWEENNQWVEEYTKMLEKHQMCFTCNHWRQQMEDDKERGEHGWAVINGKHYVLEPDTQEDSTFKGFCGAKTRITFFDGTVVKCNNLWYQGTIPEGYWRELMPDNATIEWSDDKDKDDDDSLPF